MDPAKTKTLLMPRKAAATPDNAMDATEAVVKTVPKLELTRPRASGGTSV